MSLPREKLASFVQIFHGIRACLAAGQYHELPALMLTYSAIDIAGWLDSTGSEQVNVTFTRWVNSYMLPAKSLPCSALDLYGARCGLLHTLTSTSRLSGQGKAKHLAYAWGGSQGRGIAKVV